MRLYRILFLLVFLGFAFIACQNEEEIDPPNIVMIELGAGNLKTAYQGEEFHIEAEIYANGKIDQIMLEIHKEGEHKGGGEWVVDSVYTDDYQGLKNAYFHEHLNVPATAETGTYHLHLSVNDMEGKQASFEDEITLLSN